MNRYTTIIKNKNIPGKKGGGSLDVIIPCAGIGKRMKSYGPKCLLKFAGETLIERQVRIIKDIYPCSNIVVTIGFKANKVYNNLPFGTIAVENPIYDITNVMYSIGLALRTCTSNNVLIVYGDLIFNSQTVDGISQEHSKVIVDSQSMMDSEEVGLNITDNQAEHFSYGLLTKWCHILFLTGKELDTFKNISWNFQNSKLYTFEALNMIMENGGIIKTSEPEDKFIIELDSSKDIEKANESTMHLQ